jgi:hypothetical protein
VPVESARLRLKVTAPRLLRATEPVCRHTQSTQRASPPAWPVAVTCRGGQVREFEYLDAADVDSSAAFVAQIELTSTSQGRQDIQDVPNKPVPSSRRDQINAFLERRRLERQVAAYTRS